MAFKSRNAAIPLLAFMVIGAIICATNAKPPSRVVGGYNANLGDFKWMVSLSYAYTSSVCGGAIISPRHILTAAHCIADKSPEELIVLSGIVDLRDQNGIVNSIAQFVVHPEYAPSIPNVRHIQHDIGIVVLNKDLELGGRLSSIPLATSPPRRQLASFSGWGDISDNPMIEPMILQTAQVQVVEDDECSYLGASTHSPQFLCGYQENGNLLSGDSGSPLVSGGQVIGVASATYGLRGVPDSFANVYYYARWIQSIMLQYP